MKVVKNDIKYKKLIENFDCGNLSVNSFLKSNSFSDLDSTTYLWISEDEKDLIGFYSLSVGQINLDCLSISSYLGGTIKILYFAINYKYQHKKDEEGFSFGDWLLYDCEERIRELHKLIGFSFIMICSTEQGYHFYLKNDYEEFESDMTTLVYESDKKCYKLYKSIEDIL